MIITYDLAGDLDNAATFMLAPTQVRTDVDFGYTIPVTIGDRVWHDLNANGVQDAGEPGLDGITVMVYNAATNTIAATTVTSGGGNYTFANLLPDTYYVEFGALTGYSRTLVDQGADDAKDCDANLLTGRTGNVTLSSGQVNLTMDAGYYAPVGIGDLVFNDANANGDPGSGETGLAGVLVSIYRLGFGPDGIAGNADDATAVAAQVTPASGVYSFTGLRPGTYQVGFGTLSGYNRTLADQGADDAKDSDVNAGSGLTGNYVLAAGATNNTIDAGYYQPGTITGSVLADTDNNNTGDAPLSGVTLELRDATTNTLIATTTTSGSGTYTFGNVASRQLQSRGNHRRVTTACPTRTVASLDLIGDVTPVAVTAGATDSGDEHRGGQPGSISRFGACRHRQQQPRRRPALRRDP